MGGKIWSRDEEVTFWTAIVPSSNKRLLMDRPSARNPRGWAQLATTMQEMMGPLARRRYTPLMLYEHFFQNAVLETFSPSARPFAEAYINEELRVTGHRPSERSRTITRTPASDVLASRRRRIVGRSAPSSTSSSLVLALGSNDATPPSDGSTAVSSTGSFLSAALEEEVSEQLRLTSTPGGSANAPTLAGQLPLPPPRSLYPAPPLQTAQYAQGRMVHPLAYGQANLPPILANPSLPPTSYSQYPALPPISTAIGMTAMASFAPTPYMQEPTMFSHVGSSSNVFGPLQSETPSDLASTDYSADYTVVGAGMSLAVGQSASSCAETISAVQETSGTAAYQLRFPQYEPALDPRFCQQDETEQAQAQQIQAQQAQQHEQHEQPGLDANPLDTELFVPQWQ